MMKDNNINKQINEYFNETTPEPDKKTLQMLILKMRENKNKSQKFQWKKFAVAICAVLLITPCILLPILLKDKKENFYTSNNTVKTKLSYQYTINYFNTNLPKYLFLFEECNLNYSYGFFAEETNNLLSVSLEFDKKDIPFTNLKIEFVVNKNYSIENKSVYIENATITQNNNYTLYEKEVVNFNNSLYYKCFVYENFEIYLIMDFNDIEIFEKFL